MDLGLNGKVAMVAGASKGLGFAVAHALAVEGALVSIASRSASSIQSAKGAIEEEAHQRVLAYAADMRSAAAI